MTLTPLTADAASALAVRTLGIDPVLLDLTSPEGLAASIRRAASFMCPTNPSRIIDTVLGAVRPLADANDVNRDKVAEILDLLLASGDLLELRQEQQGRFVRLVYLGPPSYIERAPGTYLLLGVRPFGAVLVDPELGEHVDLEGHTRTLQLDAAVAIDRLAAEGLRHIESERWVGSPRKEEAATLLDRISSRLDVANPAGEIEDMQILDPETRVRYYPGRWRTPKSGDTGDYVARRPQAYGADLWCVIRLENGVSQKLLELPIDDPLVPARDEAWRAQMAIDSIRGHKQQFAAEATARGDENVVKFFSPIPGFAKRHLQLVGMALGESPGALFTFKVPIGAMHGVERLLTDMLWMKPESREDLK